MGDLLTHAKQSSRLVSEANERAETAEKAAVIRDQKYGEMVGRMRQYEQGIYGLPEAVDDIKRLQEQMEIREKFSTTVNSVG